MSVRRGWLLAGAVVVITLLSFGWFMLIRPPFRFLAGAERVEFYKYPFNVWTNCEIVETYVSKRPVAELSKEVKNELRKGGFTLDRFDTTWKRTDRATSSWTLVYLESGLEGVTITIWRNADPFDRIRLLFFKESPEP
jgi:hypothetical protein